MHRGLFGLASILVLSACGGDAEPPTESTQQTAEPVVASSTSEDEIIAGLVSRMSLERKISQLIQPQINSFTADDME